MTNAGYFVVFVVGISTSLAAICPIGWLRYGDSCYYVITSLLPWEDANRTCAEKQGTLAVPRSEMEQNIIWGMYLDVFTGQPPTPLWIGCNDIEEEGKWQLCPLKNESNGYANWQDGQPDNNKEADCASMKRSGGGQWGDRPCSYIFHAACQQPADTSSTPAYCLHTGSDGRISSQCLFGHVMKELPAQGVVSCGKACCLEPRCRSFNLLEQGRDGKMACQLNDVSSDAANGTDLNEKENCYFFDI